MSIARNALQAGSRLMEIKKDSVFCLRYFPKSLMNELMTIAIERTEHVPINAPGMNTHQDVGFSGNIAVGQGKMSFRVDLAPILNRFEFSESSPDASDGFSPDEFLGLRAISNQFRDRDHLQSVLAAEIGEFGNSRHRAIRVHNFADNAAGVQSSEASEV